MRLSKAIGLAAGVALGTTALPVGLAAQEQEPSDGAAQQEAPQAQDVTQPLDAEKLDAEKKVALEKAARQRTPPPAEQRAAVIEVTADGNLLAVLAESGKYGTFVELVETAGLKGELEQSGPFTVFAPTDQAFTKLPPGELDALKQDQEALLRLVRTHIAMGEWTAGELRQSARIENILADELTLESPDPGAAGAAEGKEGEPAVTDEAARTDEAEAILPDPNKPARPEPAAADVSTSESDLRIEDATVVEEDLLADNGVVHGIDAVLEASPEPAGAAAGEAPAGIPEHPVAQPEGEAQQPEMDAAPGEEPEAKADKQPTDDMYPTEQNPDGQ